jgi:DNA-binding transcriptional ArsR family regulator
VRRYRSCAGVKLVVSDMRAHRLRSAVRPVALQDGRALTATELAAVADVTPSTASAHLTRLTEGGLICKTSRGPHLYFRLAGQEVATMREGILVVAAEPSVSRRVPASRIDPALREARSCYDHLAGRLGVGLADALIAKGALALTEDAGENGRRPEIPHILWYPNPRPTAITRTVPSALSGLE